MYMYIYVWQRTWFKIRTRTRPSTGRNGDRTWILRILLSASPLAVSLSTSPFRLHRCTDPSLISLPKCSLDCGRRWAKVDELVRVLGRSGLWKLLDEVVAVGYSLGVTSTSVRDSMRDSVCGLWVGGDDEGSSGDDDCTSLGNE